MKYKKSVIQKLKEDIREYEEQAEKGRAQSDDVYPIFYRIQKTMAAIGLDYCTVNLIKLGSKRYKKYEHLYDCSKYIMTE